MIRRYSLVVTADCVEEIIARNPIVFDPFAIDDDNTLWRQGRRRSRQWNRCICCPNSRSKLEGSSRLCGTQPAIGLASGDLEARVIAGLGRDRAGAPKDGRHGARNVDLDIFRSIPRIVRGRHSGYINQTELGTPLDAGDD